MQNDNSKCKIIFFGTPEFGATILDSLIQNKYKPITVVTAPDKPVGRKQILTPPPVKILAQKHNIPILQPESLKENLNFKSKISSLKPDLFIVAAYGLILPKEILEIPKYGSLNVHPSLLPKYRGASPIQATILNGDTETGVTIILMDEKMDHGPIVTNSKFKIQNSKLTYSELSEELSKLGANLLVETLPKWLNGEIKPIPQDHSKATFTKIIKKEDGRIDWKKSAQEIERMIRAYQPWPGAYTKIKSKNYTNQLSENRGDRRYIQKLGDDKILKIIKANILNIDHKKQPGTVFLNEEAWPPTFNLRGQASYLAVACGKNALILEEVQLEGKRKMTAQEFLNGHPEIIGSLLI